MTRAADASLPDPAALVKELKAHQEQIDQIRENYTFHRIQRVEELDGKGEVKKTTTQEREIFYVNGHPIGRLVKKSGNPLTDTEEKAEQERVRKQIERHLKEPPAYGKGGGVNLIGTILGVATISNPRRTQLNGRPTLVFDFEGDRKAEAHGMEANAAKRLAGTISIDEADHQIARLEIEFYDNFRIGGGLLGSIQKGTTVKIEQSPIGEGLWMQTANEQHANIRIVTKGFHENVYLNSFDFKRFNVEAVAKEHE